MQFIDLKTQHCLIKKEIQQAIEKVFSHGRYIKGPEVEQFEEDIQNYTGAPYAISCANGTDALELALKALNLQADDEIITSPFSFAASSEVAHYLNLKPVFVDIEEDSFTINAKKIEQSITPKTKAIIAVSLYGQTPELNQINKIAEKYNLTVIEDAAQSCGAELNGVKSGNLSQLSTFSFFPSKPLGCYGDGGMVLCQNKKIASSIRQLADHGQISRYEHKILGRNSRLDTIQAAILIQKLKLLDKEIKKRQQIADYYNQKLKNYVTIPKKSKNKVHVYAQYTIKVNDRDNFQKKMTEKNIPTAVHYHKCLHLQEMHKSLNYQPNDFPIAEQAAKQVISLPMCPYLSQTNQDKVIAAVITSLE